MHEVWNAVVMVVLACSLFEIVAYFAAPHLLAPFAVLPLGIHREFDLPAATVEALTRVDERRAGGYRDAAVATLDLGRIVLPRELLADDAVCRPRLAHNELVVRLPYKMFGFNRALAVARVTITPRGNGLVVHARFAPTPLLALALLAVGGLVSGLAALTSRGGGGEVAVGAAVSVGFVALVVGLNTFLARSRMFTAVQNALDVVEPVLLDPRGSLHAPPGPAPAP